jgi:hypothetical protein
MPVAGGTKFGPYEVESLVGAGGMGEVYRARDTRLQRTVAIKILPPHLSKNPDQHARFVQEAKAISGLQHPNICVLHDIGKRFYSAVSWLTSATHKYGAWDDGNLYKNIPVERILEDIFFRDSADSYFIQLADFCAYALFRSEHPLSKSKAKYQLETAFYSLDKVLTPECFGKEGSAVFVKKFCGLDVNTRMAPPACKGGHGGAGKECLPLSRPPRPLFLSGIPGW